jgi:outer membrane usher protein
MPPGTAGKLEGGDDFVVGYDGRAYIKGLSATNTVVVSDGTNECHASFPFEAKANTQIVVGPVTCQ